MPELPEVETTLRAIRPILRGRTIHGIEIRRLNMTLGTDLTKQLSKRTVTELRRHGKYLFIDLHDGQSLIVHLKMSGRLGYRKRKDPELTYERILIDIGNDELIIFNDPRTLGRLWVIDSKTAHDHPSIKLLGPDAMSIGEKEFTERLKKKRGVLKGVLLDQSFVAGIGNIYADEACFLAKIKPTRRTESLTDKERSTIYKAVMKTLQKGIDNMGTSFSDFADLFGKPGQNQRTLMVYGRSGEACRVCKTKLQSTKVGQRTTVWCPLCQK